MKLLVDNNLPPRLGRGLGELFRGIHEVQQIVDKFGRGDLADEDWIERLGHEGKWCVLSGDRRIATKRPSRQLVIAAGIVGFFPQPSVTKLDHARQASRILAVWHRLDDELLRHKAARNLRIDVAVETLARRANDLVENCAAPRGPAAKCGGQLALKQGDVRCTSQLSQDRSFCWLAPLRLALKPMARARLPLAAHHLRPP